MVGVHLIVRRFIQGGAAGRQKRGGQQQRETQYSCEHNAEKKCRAVAILHILMKRLMPRMKAAIEAATSRAKLPRMTYSQIVEMMLKNDGMRPSIL